MRNINNIQNTGNAKDIEKTVEEVLIEYISKEIVRRLVDRNKKAIVLFTGAAIGFNQSIKSLNELKYQGWKFKIMMTDGAKKALGESLIKQLLPEEDAEIENGQYNFVIVPTLTINTASKIVNCISDNPVTNIISKAISSQIPVVASINACCPDNEERKAMGFYPTEAYKNKLRSHLECMRSYGINLTTSENLAGKVNKVFMEKYHLPVAEIHKDVLSNEEQEQKRLPSVHKGEVIRIDDKVISRSCILNNSNFSIIRINKDSVITALAREEAEKLNIKLMKE